MDDAGARNNPVHTACELAAGLVLNVWLDIGVWDYSHMWGNLWGQICPQYAALWFALSLVMIPAFDWIRWAVEGGEHPYYRWFTKSNK